MIDQEKQAADVRKLHRGIIDNDVLCSASVLIPEILKSAFIGTDIHSSARIFENVTDEGGEPVEFVQFWVVATDLAVSLDDIGQTVAYDVGGLAVWGRRQSGDLMQDPSLERIAEDHLRRLRS